MKVRSGTKSKVALILSIVAALALLFQQCSGLLASLKDCLQVLIERM